MNDDNLDKFVENMRASGYSDDMIADNLMAAGRSQIEVLNLFGVEDLSQLKAPTDEEDDSEPTQSPAQAVDAGGAPLINEHNLPKPIGQRPTRRPFTRSKRRPVAQPHARSDSARSAPKDSGFTPTPSSIIAPPLKESPRLPDEQTLAAAPQPQPKPASPTTRPTPKQNNIARPKQAPAKSHEYGHHTFDDFMQRIDSHPELPEGHTQFTDKFAPQDEATPTSHKDVSESDIDPRSLNELLNKQKMAAIEEKDTEPGIDAFVSEKDLEELRKMPEPALPDENAPKDIEALPETPEIEQAGEVVRNLQKSIALKVVVIAIGVLALVGLTLSVMSKING